MKTIFKINSKKGKGKARLYKWAELDDPEIKLENAYYIAAIEVPRKYRGKGLGSVLLSRIIKAADKEKITLVLEAVSYGSFGSSANNVVGANDDDQLKKWYARYGFRQHPIASCYLMRRPRKATR